jgi:hypothetical protein
VNSILVCSVNRCAVNARDAGAETEANIVHKTVIQDVDPMILRYNKDLMGA